MVARRNDAGDLLLRVLLKDGVEVVLPQRSMVLALIPDAEITETKKHRIYVPRAWANGDGIEVTLRRVPVGSEAP